MLFVPHLHLELITRISYLLGLVVSSKSPSIPPASTWDTAFIAVTCDKTVPEIFQTRIFYIPSEGEECLGRGTDNARLDG